jgi:ATP-dependent helicase/nuclease subunit A
MPRARAGKADLAPLAIPEFLRKPAPIEARPPRPLAPSQIVEDSDVAPPPSPEMREAARRGSLLHSLFERLPGVDPSERMLLAIKWLQRAGVKGSAQRRLPARLVRSSPILLTRNYSPPMHWLKHRSPRITDGRVIAGTVDRLCIGTERVRVIDFKTGRTVPPASLTSLGAQSANGCLCRGAKDDFPRPGGGSCLLYTSGRS